MATKKSLSTASCTDVVSLIIRIIITVQIEHVCVPRLHLSRANDAVNFFPRFLAPYYFTSPLPTSASREICYKAQTSKIRAAGCSHWFQAAVNLLRAGVDLLTTCWRTTRRHHPRLPWKLLVLAVRPSSRSPKPLFLLAACLRKPL